MAYKPQSSFAAGEFDPALHERTTLEKYRSGLAKARGIHIAKTGRIVSMPGTTFDIFRKFNNKRVVTFVPNYSDYELEFGDQYVRIHNLLTGTYVEAVTPYLEADLDTLHFDSDKTHCYIYSSKYDAKKMLLGAIDTSLGPDFSSRFTNIDYGPDALFWSPSIITVTPSGTPAGYDVEYTATFMLDGVETLAGGLFMTSGKLPIASGQSNVISCQTSMRNKWYNAVEMKVYRRPKEGGAFGLVGSTNFTSLSGSNLVFKFTDVGGEADYSNVPPFPQVEYRSDIETYNPGNPPSVLPSIDISYKFPTGILYQQRCLVSGIKTPDAIFASRVKYKNYWHTQFVPDNSSSLAFKSGTSGRAEVLRMLDAGPLVAFTTAGIYANNRGALNPDNIGMNYKGGWVIDQKIPPLKIPGGFLFVEEATNSIIFIQYSDTSDSFAGGEITTYSDHLFRGKRVKSWAYQPSEIPTVWIVMDDGTVNTLSYLPEQQLLCWTWFDILDGNYENVSVHKQKDGENVVYFTVNKNGLRYREKLTDRFEMNFMDYVGCHSAKIFNQSFSSLTLDPVTLGDWDGPMTLLSGTPVFTNAADLGAVGTIFRYFTTEGAQIDLTVTAFNSTSSLTVQTVNGETFPSDQASNVKVYRTWTTLTGLNHLNGLPIYVKADGFIVANPLDPNAVQSYTVASNQITLQDRAAIVIVGVPKVEDIETLDVDTVEQAPSLLASVSLKKMYLKYFESRGVYVAPEFPSDNSITGMTSTETQEAWEDEVQQSGKPRQPFTKRVEVMDVGSWRSHGKICMRNVSGHPVQILSIISDLDVERI